MGLLLEWGNRLFEPPPRAFAWLGCVLFLFDPARPLLFEGVLTRCDLLGKFGGGWFPFF